MEPTEAILKPRTDDLFPLGYVAFSNQLVTSMPNHIHFSGQGKATHPQLLKIFHLSRLEPRALQTFSHIVRPWSKGPQKPTETGTWVGEKQAFWVKVHSRCGGKCNQELKMGPGFSQPSGSFPVKSDLVLAVAICLLSSVFISQTSI